MGGTGEDLVVFKVWWRAKRLVPGRAEAPANGTRDKLSGAKP